MEGKGSRKQRTQTAPDVPTEAGASRQFERHVELGELEEVEATAGHPSVPRYLVTYMYSQTGSAIRSATVVSVTNQANQTNLVTVSYFKGFTSNAAPVGVTSFSIPPDFTLRGLTPTVRPGLCEPCHWSDLRAAAVTGPRGRVHVFRTTP
jgi:hypothetical protein